MPEDSEKKGRKRVVVEEVETPVSTEVVSSNELPKEDQTPEILDEAAKTQSIDKEAVQVEEKVVAENMPISNPKASSLGWWIIIPGIFLLGALLGGIVFYQKGISKGEVLTPTPTSEALNSAENPTPTPITQLDLTKFSVNILNGSGIPGEASKAKDLLVAAGFKISGTGNASSYNFTKTVVKAKSSVDADFVTKLVEALGKSYSVDKTQTLSDSSADDVQVVVGSTKSSQ